MKHISPRRRMETGAYILPIQTPRNNSEKAETFRSRPAEKWIHAIPLVVLFCLFTLWWFSYPVDVVVKDGRIEPMHRIEIPREGNATRVELAILASARAPLPSVPLDFVKANETKAPTTVVNLEIAAVPV